jgi:Transglycosylase-like domain
VNVRKPLAVAGACATVAAAPAAIALGADAGAPTVVQAGTTRAPLGAVSAADRAQAAQDHRRLRHDVQHLVRTVARLRGRHPSPRALRAVGRMTTAQLRHERRALRRQAHRLRRAARVVAVPPALRSIAACESGGDPRAVGGGGTFRGKYQFDLGTWRAVGGTGDPAAAPEAEQDRRAAMLYARRGSAPWPVCGR